MITLKSGLPRNGKTLSLVTELAALFARWEKHPGEARPVFQFGVTDLVLPGVGVIDAWPASGKKGDAIPLTVDGKPGCALTFDQGDYPDGALLCIDECQDFYPPRGPSQQPPLHIKALNTHGHRNLDYVILTQHPKLIDNAVRRLVNKHQHYRRAFGGGSAVTYEWDVCSDALEYQKAIKGVFRYPKKSFGLYKSASGFVRPKFRLPMFLIIPALALPLAVWAIPSAYKALSGAATGKGVGSGASAASAPLGGASPRPVSSLGGPSSSGRPATAWRDWASVAGCMSLGPASCQCRDQRGVKLPVDLAVCQASASGFDGVVKWAPRDEVKTAGASPSPTLAAAGPAANSP